MDAFKALLAEISQPLNMNSCCIQFYQLIKYIPNGWGLGDLFAASRNLGTCWNRIWACKILKGSLTMKWQFIDTLGVILMPAPTYISLKARMSPKKPSLSVWPKVVSMTLDSALIELSKGVIFSTVSVPKSSLTLLSSRSTFLRNALLWFPFNYECNKSKASKITSSECLPWYPFLTMLTYL